MIVSQLSGGMNHVLQLQQKWTSSPIYHVLFIVVLKMFIALIDNIHEVTKLSRVLIFFVAKKSLQSVCFELVEKGRKMRKWFSENPNRILMKKSESIKDAITYAHNSNII